MVKLVCPLRILAQEIGKESASRTKDKEATWADIVCFRDLCAWWNSDFGTCSIAALATVATRPIAIQEMRG